jgi:hypothetical protein
LNEAHWIEPVTLESVIPAAVIPAENVCAALHVLACAGLSEAITAPLVGEMVRLPSLFATLVTPKGLQTEPFEIHNAVALPALVQFVVPLTSRIPLGVAGAGGRSTKGKGRIFPAGRSMVLNPS